MRKGVIIVYLGLLLGLSSEVFAEDFFTIKAGYNDILCQAISSGPSAEVSYEYRYKPLACELGLGYGLNHISQVGELYQIDTFIRGKVYIGNIYIGAGIGYYNNFICESYDGQADVDDEVNYQALLGWDFGSWIVEVKGVISDLDIETGLPYETEIEKHSRADSMSFRIGRKF